jgi:outer membrane protein TolC
LSDVILTTLKNNRAIQVESYNRNIARDAVEAAQGIYDLLLQASYEYGRGRGQSPVRDADADNELAESKYAGHGTNASLSQLFQSGGVLQFFTGYGWQRNYNQSTPTGPDYVDPTENLFAGLAFSQPLLRGLGSYVTNAPIQIARINESATRENFRLQVINQLANAVQTYWDYVFAINNYEVQRLSLERARESLRVTMVKNEAGVEPPNVVLQAQAEVSRREATLINALRQIADTADLLKLAMNISDSAEDWQHNLIPVDRPIIAPVSLDEEQIYAEALDFRPDYRSAKLGLNVAEIDIHVKKNARRPQLNAIADARLTGRGSSVGNAWDSMDGGDYYDWGVGLNFIYPLQNRRANAEYRQATTRFEQGGERLKSLEEIIRLEVRSTIRAIEANLKSIAAFDANVKAEEAKLDSQLKRYDVGFATIFEVLNFQEDLANAQVNYLQAVINYNKELIELQRVKASFLADYRVEVLDNPVRRRLNQMEEESTVRK